MTRFLNITNSTEISESGGNYPQIERTTKDYGYDEAHSIFTIQNLDTDENYFIESPEFILSKSSKLTDFLSFNSDFFIVSERVINLLNQFSLPPSRQFGCIVKHGDKKYSYVILYFFRGRYDFTDYKKSRFTLRYFEKNARENSILHSKNAFQKEKKEAYQLFTNIIYVQSRQKINFDLFKVNERQTDYFISEKLQQTFINNQITGIDYLENTDTVFFPADEKNILYRYQLKSNHFLTRTSWYSNGVLCRQFNSSKNIIEEYNRTGKKQRELIFQRGKYNGSERVFFANGHIQIEKMVKNRQEQQYKYYFNNGQLNYAITYHDIKGILCDKVFSIDGKELKGYKLSKGTGKILHFNSNGKGGKELTFKSHGLIKEKKF